MAGKLLPYLQRISADTTALRKFQKNPAAAAKEAGLSREETRAVISKNPAALAAAIREGGGVATDSEVNVTIVVVVAP